MASSSGLILVFLCETSASLCVSAVSLRYAAIFSAAVAKPLPSVPNWTVTASEASPTRVPRKPWTMYWAPWLAAEAGTVASVNEGRRVSLVEPGAPPIPTNAPWPGSLRETAKNAPVLAAESLAAHE